MIKSLKGVTPQHEKEREQHIEKVEEELEDNGVVKVSFSCCYGSTTYSTN